MSRLYLESVNIIENKMIALKQMVELILIHGQTTENCPYSLKE